MKREFALIAIIALIGCQSATSVNHTLHAAPPIPPSPGWAKPNLGNIGFTMMLPEGWEAKTLGEKQAPSQGPKNFSDAVLGGWSERDTGFIAIGRGDPSGKSEALYTFIAIRSLKNPGTKVDQDIADMAFSLKEMGMSIEDIKRKTVTLPVGNAEKIQYHVKSSFLEEITEAFFVVDGDYHYQFTFSSMGTGPISLPGDAVMTTFRTDWMATGDSK